MMSSRFSRSDSFTLARRARCACHLQQLLFRSAAAAACIRRRLHAAQAEIGLDIHRPAESIAGTMIRAFPVLEGFTAHWKKAWLTTSRGLCLWFCC